MAKFYFCNGTKQNNLPCAIHVKEERDKCHFHGGGGPILSASQVYKSTKSVMDAVVYSHTVFQAYPFVQNIIEKTITIVTPLLPSFANISNLKSSTYDVIDKSQELSELMDEYKNEIINNISIQNEDTLTDICQTLYVLDSYLEQGSEGEATMVMTT
ncbi:hypothetical protein LXN10_13415 [Arcobacter sp. KX21116]|uniref:hypothetical protein n=1 Tax=Arcobacter iocasae TaxID=2906515 RepID=UPI0035D48D9D